MTINNAIHKAVISHDLVNKLFIAKMSLAKKQYFQCFKICKSLLK